MWTNPRVTKSLHDLYQALIHNGHETLAAVWDSEPEKGIDDLLAAGKQPQIVPVNQIHSKVEKIIEDEKREKQEAQAAAQAATAAAAAPLPEKSATELGLAKRFVLQHKDNIRWIYGYRCFAAWDGRHWVMDDESESTVYQLMEQTARGLYAEAAQAQSKDIRETLAKFAVECESYNKQTNALRFVKKQKEISLNVSQFDADKYAINFLNGTFDLKENRFREHRIDDLITKIIPLNYNPLARCPLWLQTLETAFNSNQTLIRFFQKAMGYSISGDVSEQKFFVCHGRGANGISTLLECIAGLLGDSYHKKISSDSLTSSKEREKIWETASLPGVRFVTSSETKDGAKLAEERIKEWTGSNTLAAEKKGQDPFNFKPQFKLWIDSNFRMQIRGNDFALKRRLVEIPFLNTLTDVQKDRALPVKLQGEHAGIVNWLIDGFQLWMREGLEPLPNEIKESVSEWCESFDAIGRFIQERCVLGVNCKSTKSTLYESYIKYCEEVKEHYISMNKFGRDLKDRGYDECRIADSKGWFGIGVLDSSHSRTERTVLTQKSVRRDYTTRKDESYTIPGQNGQNGTFQDFDPDKFNEWQAGQDESVAAKRTDITRSVSAGTGTDGAAAPSGYREKLSEM